MNHPPATPKPPPTRGQSVDPDEAERLGAFHDDALDLDVAAASTVDAYLPDDFEIESTVFEELGLPAPAGGTS